MSEPPPGPRPDAGDPDDPAGAEGAAVGEDAPPHDERGLDLARSIARSLAGRTGTRRRRPKNLRPVDPKSSSAHPDDRDPQTLDTTLDRLVRDQGWETDLRVNAVFTRWAAIVGSNVAAHVVPESFSDGRLVVRTDSTAWATEMKLLAGNVLQRLNQVLGEGTVDAIDVHGPHAPRWTSGRFRVKGRGPRDTYG